MRWSRENNMALHDKKFKLIIHRANPDLLIHELPFSTDLWIYKISEGLELLPVNELRDLGVGISSDRSWSPHISLLAVKAMSMAAWVLSVFRCRSEMVMLTVYKSLVRSHLEYCCPMWHPHKIEDIQRLEQIQRVFTSKITGMSSLSYWERIRSLEIMSLQRRRERYIIIHMWKLLHEIVPNDLIVKFRSSRVGNQTLFQKSFAVIGPQLSWKTRWGYTTTTTTSFS